MISVKSQNPPDVRRLKVIRLVTPPGKRNPTWGLCQDETAQEEDPLHQTEIYFHIREGKVITYQAGQTYTFGATDRTAPQVGEYIIGEVIPNQRSQAQHSHKLRKWGRLPVTRMGK